MQVEEDVIIIINEFTHEDGERRGRQIDKREGPITYVLCGDLHLSES